MTNDVAIKVSNVSKNFVLPHEKKDSIKSIFTNIFSIGKVEIETQQALKDITFEIKKGEFFGIVGRNGSGKSTLLKILAGIYQPTKGTIKEEGRLVPFIELGVGFNPELSGRDNVFLNGAMMGFSRKEIISMYDEIVSFAELEEFMDKKLKNYSSGMQVRLAFSMATRAKADILLVDEVLAVGDADFQKKCYKYFKNLKKSNTTVVFVSHDMRAIEEYCDRAILIENSEIVIGGTSREVSAAYTRMFLEQNDEKTNDLLVENKKRWGNGEIKYDSIALSPSKIYDNPMFKIKTIATAREDIKEAIFGFSIRGLDDKRMLGSNNKIKNKIIKDLRRGQKISLEWEVANIFNTGNYMIDIAIQNEDYSTVYDWWEDSSKLQVERSEDNSYSIQPMINLHLSNNKKIDEK